MAVFFFFKKKATGPGQTSSVQTVRKMVIFTGLPWTGSHLLPTAPNGPSARVFLAAFSSASLADVQGSVWDCFYSGWKLGYPSLSGSVQ